ncbi:MAG TPA: hypothetical protein PKC43_06205 [Phycisphaerales bacterium]|nr:hypothetical protein [Phycisphaerales bacterium]HMP37024.1 hypothetical protein [Phycisphaerales bacterium]
MTSNYRWVWQTASRDQGQIVARQYPQLLRAAEGEEGTLTRHQLRLHRDHGDGTWTITSRGRTVASGGAGDPIPEPAAAAAAAKRAGE